MVQPAPTKMLKALLAPVDQVEKEAFVPPSSPMVPFVGVLMVAPEDTIEVKMFSIEPEVNPQPFQALV